jgi:hypothetical protein
MEVLSEFGTEEQKQRWLSPLLEGKIRSAFAMTEPDVASSDATNISTRIERDGDDYVINGRKWWITGAMNPDADSMGPPLSTGAEPPASASSTSAFGLLCHRRFRVISGKSLTRWNGNSGAKLGGSACGRAADVDGARRELSDGGPGRGVVGGPPLPLVPEYGSRVCDVAVAVVDVPGAAWRAGGLARRRRAGGLGIPGLVA